MSAALERPNSEHRLITADHQRPLSAISEDVEKRDDCPPLEPDHDQLPRHLASKAKEEVLPRISHTSRWLDGKLSSGSV